MTVAWFWLLGLLGIGTVTAILSRNFRVHTTADQGTAKGIIVWGCVIMTLWIIYGGPLILMSLEGK